MGTFASMLVVNTSGLAVPDAVGQVFAPSDITAATPLPVTDLNGIAFPSNQLVASPLGVLPPFRVSGYQTVDWVSGSFRVPIPSIDQVPSGGSTGQVLAKISGGNYDLQWVDPNAQVTAADIGAQPAGDYATNTSLTSGLAAKAATSHVHTVSNVTGLQTALDGKATLLTPAMRLGFGPTLPTTAQAGDFWFVTVASTVPTPPPAPAPGYRAFPLVASLDLENTGESVSQKFTRTLSYGYNGMVYYSGGSLGWNAQLAQMAVEHGTKPINLQVTPKVYNEADLRSILSNLPAAWKPGFRWNYYQEPEDNLTTSASQLAYRNVYTAAAAVHRDYPGVGLPWVEWAEWTTEMNSNGDFSRDLAHFMPPAADIGGVLWSFFEYGENVSLTRLDTKVARVVNAMSTYAPGKPWEIMASCYTLEGVPYSSAQLAAQAQWLTQSFNKLRAAGCVGWAWYNVLFGGTGGAAGEGRVEKNPAALSALKTIAAAGYTVPNTN